MSYGRMRTEDFDYTLPPELIAQHPAPERDASRLLVLERNTGRISHQTFRDFPLWLRAGDLLVLNDSRVIPARLRAVNARTGGAFEVLLLEENAPDDWWAMMRPGRRARVGTRLDFLDRNRAPTAISAIVREINAEGHRRLLFQGAGGVWDALEKIGEPPLPPYIQRDDGSWLSEDFERYQTVFARAPGSVAAPTAGLHFTPEILDEIRRRNVQIATITLHVGPGTFAPVKTSHVENHIMHEERFYISPDTAAAVEAALREGRRVIAAGTTTLRALESAAAASGRISAGPARTRLFVYPPFNFRVAGALLTNFHLPRSTLLMLVCAFADPGRSGGRQMVLSAYAEAVARRYRFFSYGDAMLII